jgi:dihydroxyacetone kinase-like predicted kinase
MSKKEVPPVEIVKPVIDPVYTIDGGDLKKLFFAALLWLKNHQPVINSLNVFPVPDGDTGTNMFLTMQSAYNEIAESKEKNLGKVIHMVAQGALMGARGNSGVILSQLLRGFARALDGLKHGCRVNGKHSLKAGILLIRCCRAVGLCELFQRCHGC